LLNLWNDEHAAQYPNELALRAYSSRLLGANPALVLHGGGNTSLKTDKVLWVKGSGSDLAQVTERDFTPLAIEPVLSILHQRELSNEQMMAALVPCVREAGRPKPSIETLLHAALPFRFVEHTHADAILAVTNTRNGEAIARRIFGDLAPLVPFRHSGFDLAKTSFEVFQRERTPRTIGLILLQHGVFAFGDTAKAAYENMLVLAGRAEAYLAEHDAWQLPHDEMAPRWSALEIAVLRRDISRAAGLPLLARVRDDAHTLAFARGADLAQVLQEGPATPQHAVFIKRMPMVGRDVANYAAAYGRYTGGAKDAPDPAPRVVLDPAFGALVLGFGPDYLQITDDIFLHGREIMTRASAHDRYQGLPAQAILEAEIHYGGFEKRLLKQDPLRGSCIGMALSEDTFAASLRAALTKSGAMVVNLVEGCSPESIVSRWGGLDALVVEPSQRSLAERFMPLLECAPFSGKLLYLSGEAIAEVRGVQSVAVRRDTGKILKALVAT
jgi:rhamnose utilization protein RhaD (predicted bifunctional aldolase and dehydrogenase)